MRRQRATPSIMVRIKGPGTPNTREQLDGLTPRGVAREILVRAHLCDRCRSTWVEPNKLYCEMCLAKIQAYSRQATRRNTTKVKDKNPRWLEVVIAPVSKGGRLTAVITTDIERLLTIENLESVDVRRADTPGGKGVVVPFRANGS